MATRATERLSPALSASVTSASGKERSENASNGCRC